MGGGLMQLVALGKMDEYLISNNDDNLNISFLKAVYNRHTNLATESIEIPIKETPSNNNSNGDDNPNISFFKAVYNRHTNFTTESIEIPIKEMPSYNNSILIDIPNNGDLLKGLHLEFEDLDTNVDNPTTSIIDYVELLINGKSLGKLYGHWMEVWFELTQENPNCYNPTLTADRNDMVNATRFQRMSACGGCKGAKVKHELAYLPLPFWFCQHIGSALPLVKLQQSNVKLKISFTSNPNEYRFWRTSHSFPKIKLWGDYVFLDMDERHALINNNQMYLIEQVQFQNSTNSNQHRLNFKNPTKEIIWTGGINGSCTPLKLPSTNWNITFNCNSRFPKRDTRYFTRYQVLEHHTGHSINDSIAVYSFALIPEESQPSGSFNFNMMDAVHLKSDIDTSIYIYAINYNILRVLDKEIQLDF